jgi:hypothetical protein
MNQQPEEDAAITSPTLGLSAVVARLEKLERELLATKRRNRRLLVAVGLVAVGVVLAWTLANITTSAQVQGAKILRANEFRLEDATGKLRAALRVMESGPGLGLFGETGKIQATLSVRKESAGLTLYDENGPRVILDAKSDGVGDWS